MMLSLDSEVVTDQFAAYGTENDNRICLSLVPRVTQVSILTAVDEHLRVDERVSMRGCKRRRIND